VTGEIGGGSGDIGERIGESTVVMVGIGEIGEIRGEIGETTVIGSMGEIGGRGEIPISPPKAAAPEKILKSFAWIAGYPRTLRPKNVLQPG
jgi:hypothetical protein